MDYTYTPYKRKPRRKRRGLPSRQKLERELWKVFSLFIRQRDERCMVGTSFQGYLCSGPLQAGHVISRRRLATKYDEKNVHGQCARHNWIHNRNPETYINWFLRTYGADEFANLVRRSEQAAKVLDRNKLQAMIDHYKGLLTENKP